VRGLQKLQQLKWICTKLGDHGLSSKILINQ